MATDATNREAAVALAEALGNLPLALEQAAAYTAQSGLSLAEYLELFRERAAAYVPHASPSADYPNALAVTFEIAFARLREESPDAADLLTLCAFLAPDDVPLEIFNEIFKEAAEVRVLPAAAERLQAYSLAKVRGGSFLSMHRLTQAVARDRLGEEERKRWAETAAKLMEAVFPFNIENTRTWPPSARLLQHALTSTEHAGALGVALESAAAVLNNVGLYLHNNAEFGEARSAFEKSAELCERLFGPTHPKLAVRLCNLAETLRMQGNLDVAAEHLKRALAIEEASLGPDHSSVAVSLNNIGSVLYQKGDNVEARKYFERALTAFETLYGPKHAYVATTLNNIGMTLHAQDDLKGARDYYERALPIDEEVYGPGHPNLAIDLSNISLALTKLGDLRGARKYMERALEIFREHLGEKHPLTVGARQHLEELDKLGAGGTASE